MRNLATNESLDKPLLADLSQTETDPTPTQIDDTLHFSTLQNFLFYYSEELEDRIAYLEEIHQWLKDRANLYEQTQYVFSTVRLIALLLFIPAMSLHLLNLTLFFTDQDGGEFTEISKPLVRLMFRLFTPIGLCCILLNATFGFLALSDESKLENYLRNIARETSLESQEGEYPEHVNHALYHPNKQYQIEELLGILKVTHDFVKREASNDPTRNRTSLNPNIPTQFTIWSVSKSKKEPATNSSVLSSSSKRSFFSFTSQREDENNDIEAPQEKRVNPRLCRLKREE